MISADQITQIDAKLSLLKSDKADADAKLTASTAADAAREQAINLAATALSDHQATDAKALATLTDLVAYMDGIAKS